MFLIVLKMTSACKTVCTLKMLESLAPHVCDNCVANCVRCDVELIHSQGCHDGDIRLAGGRNATEGRLEFCYGGVWGTVCRDRWGTPDARVACRQLGFSSEGISCTGLH